MRIEGDLWVVVASKRAIQTPAGTFRPLVHRRHEYPTDAVAACAQGARHRAPDPRCTCGFHAVSTGGGLPGGAEPELVELEVLLSGRIVASAWHGDAVLFRAERQTVVKVIPGRSASGVDVERSRTRIQLDVRFLPAPPAAARVVVPDLGQVDRVVAHWASIDRRRRGFPPGAAGVAACRPRPEADPPGARRLRLPSGEPSRVALDDDPGYGIAVPVRPPDRRQYAGWYPDDLDSVGSSLSSA